MEPSKLQFQNHEVAGHCLRVAALSRRVAAILPLTDSNKDALELAALLHKTWSPIIGPGELSRIVDALLEPGEIPPPGPCVDAADRILAAMQSTAAAYDDQTALAAQVLDASATFDEAVEFSAFERIPAGDAIASFLQGMAGGFVRPVRQALRRATLCHAAARQYERLPVMPGAALKIMRTSDENTSPAEIQSIAGSDPVLCARLLQVANSARFSGREPVVRVADAAARVGVPLARKVLLSACFAPLFASRRLQDLWVHSQRVAAATSEIARTLSFDPDLAYTAGLLHDIGRLVLETSSADSQVKLAKWISDGFPLTLAETLTYGHDHARVGADLLRSWHLPPEIADGVGNHHQPEQTRSVLASMLFMAEEWCRRESNDASEGLSAAMRMAHAEQQSGMTVDTLRGLGSDSDLLSLAG